MKEKSSLAHEKEHNRDIDEKKNEHIKKISSLSSRLKAAAIFLPILIFMLYYKILYTLLMISNYIFVFS